MEGNGAIGQMAGFQSTRPLRGATAPPPRPTGLTGISIHAPLAGRDGSPSLIPSTSINFNPRAPCGARLKAAHSRYTHNAFQSTRPLRGATSPLSCRYVSVIFQSTRPLRGATGRVSARPVFLFHFNPRAPCGARPYVSPWLFYSTYFNPRAPCGARPRNIFIPGG